MFSFLSISIKYINFFKVIFLLFLLCGCKEHIIADEDKAGKENTLNDSSLNGSPLSDYFYNFENDINAQYLYYSLPYYDGMSYNTMSSPDQMSLNRDTLNFKTFPDYLLDVAVGDNNIDKRLYYLNERNPDDNNWCDTLLLKYSGNCPSAVDFDGDGQSLSTGVFKDLEVNRDTTFIVDWDDIDSLKWLPDKDRYDVILKQTQYDTAVVSYSDLETPDYYDSLIYIAVIDTNRTKIDNLIYIDRSEWDVFDTIYRQPDYSIILQHTFNYQTISISQDSLMFRVNADCNQNGQVDAAERYWDWGADWCPDSLETGEGLCIADGEPCNCLGNWMVEDVLDVNTDWQTAVNNGYHLDSLWWYGEHWRELDPNGDRWRDCGCDGLCFNDSGWTGADPGESEGNYIVDCDEKFESNFQYDFNLQKSSGEYFEDIGNNYIDEAEFCSGFIDGEDCFGEFEDKNCNGKWDGAESEELKNRGNGLRDSDESWRDDNGDGIVQPNEIYYITQKMGNYLVNYPENGSPIPLTSIDQADTIRVKYLSGENSFYVTFDSLVVVKDIVESPYASYRPIDSIRTIYTNKIIESGLEGQDSDYFITKTSWYEPVSDDFGQRDYDYDYHIFHSNVTEGQVVKLVHPKYFKHYGFETDLKNYDEAFYSDPSIMEEVYIYAPSNQIRDGEYYFSEDTIYSAVANYHVADEYTVEKDNAVNIGIRRILYDTAVYQNTGDIVCLADTLLDVVKVDDCPLDSVVTDAYKITRTKIYTMLGNGVEFGFRNTFWLGHDEVNGKPLGLIKDKIEYRWSEAPWEEFGSGWKEYSRLELRSLRSPDTSLPRVFSPTQMISIGQLGKSIDFNFDPFRFSSSYGLHRIREYYGE